MTYALIDVAPLNPVIGAEISGVDLGKPLGNQLFQEIHDALIAHQVIFFRDQRITLDEHKAFGRMFGELHIHPSGRGPEGHPEILVIHADENSKVIAGQEWHSDVSCEEEPPMGSILHLHEVPSAGGDTLFASMYATYEALSGKLQRFLDGLVAVHASAHVYGGRFGAKPKDHDFPSAEHPVVRTHPVTGRKALFVNPNFTTHIKDLARKESDAVLGLLSDHIRNPAFQCRFRWRPYSIAFWDNRATQHLAVWDYYPARRHGYRVTIKGDRPY